MPARAVWRPPGDAAIVRPHLSDRRTMNGQSDTQTRNVLVIKLGAFGDLVLCDGAMRDIRAHHRGARIAVLTEERYRSFFERSPRVDDVLTDPRASWLRIDLLWDLRRRLRAGGFDRVYDFQCNRRSALYHRWLDAEWSGDAPGCSHPIPLANVKAVPVLDRLEAQLRAAGVKTRHTGKPDIGWMCDDVSGLMERWGLEPGFVLLIPGSSARHPQKRWPHYAALAELLIEEGRQVAIALGPDELDFTRTIPGTPLLKDGRPLSLFELAGAMAKARLVVGNDTGPTHIAAHLGVPGLALFSAYHSPRLTCLDRFLEVIEEPDLKALQPDRVYERAQALLEG